MSDKTYIVTGMTCEHCVLAVSHELASVAGVERVAVRLEDGRVTVTGMEFSDVQVSAAITRAGYTLEGAE